MDVRNPSSDSPSPRPIKATNEARQGVSGHNVRMVLGVALAAIVVIFGLLWLFYFGR
jgi:F0F1-type ATP synthase membrane subunit c/vacuolar-type H+-ATPase subunit K